MNKLRDEQTGKHILVHGYAVLQTEEYKGWEIRKFLSGSNPLPVFQGVRKTLAGEVSTQVFPWAWEVKKAIRVFNDKAKKEYGISNRGKQGTVTV